MNALKQYLRTAYRSYDAFMCSNRAVSGLIQWQHLNTPLPLCVFALLFRHPTAKRLLNFYGRNCFLSQYRRRKDDLSYWLSNESLYWHFWHQTTMDTTVLKEVLAIPQVLDFLSHDPFTVVEIGFGMGKNYGACLRSRIKCKEYVAVEPNSRLCKYVQKKFRGDRLRVINQSIESFGQAPGPFDVLLAFGGTFNCLSSDVVDAFFASMCNRGVRKILILGEGTAGDEVEHERGGHTCNFRRRLEKAGYGGAHFLEHEQDARNGILEYFVMY